LTWLKNEGYHKGIEILVSCLLKSLKTGVFRKKIGQAGERKEKDKTGEIKKRTTV